MWNPKSWYSFYRTVHKLTDWSHEYDCDLCIATNRLYGINGTFAFDNMFTARVAKRAKVMFSQASVCSTLGGGLPWVGGGGLPWEGWGLSPKADPPQEGREPGNMVNERVVCILLECILVIAWFLSLCLKINVSNHVTHFWWHQKVSFLFIFFFKIFVGHMSICGATDTPILDFWWCLIKS